MRARRREILRTMLTAVALAASLVTVFYISPLEGGRPGAVVIRIALALVALVVAVALGLRYIDRAAFPMLRMFEALAGIVAFAVVTFASAYVMMSHTNPASFSEQLGHTDALYFAMTTITTIGYGDISPHTEAARIVVMLQMVVNVLVLGVAARSLLRSARQADT